ncbi:MAG: MBL fold metallo-hydrolase [Candidatus Eisenbacteria bacterium]|nr:MBL fold metallo-hydrolase [Candidatus Eisenbacteria bacterium]
MEILFLGTSGATLTPRVGCGCRVCREARARGGRHVRSGPSLYLSPAAGDAGVLIDTPEEIHAALLRWGVERVDAVFFTHWHPDHTAGVRLFEHLNVDWRAAGGERAHRCTPVYLPRRVARDFEKHQGLMERLRYLEERGLLRVCEIEAGEAVEAAGLRFRAFPMANPELWTLEVSGDGRRAVLAVDDTRGYEPEEFLSGADVAVIETGWFEFDPAGARIQIPGHPKAQAEASFEESLRIAARLGAGRTYFTHIEEICQRTPEDYEALERTPALRAARGTFAWDGLRVTV